MIIGYARVSTQEQSMENQIFALKEAGCEIVFEDRASGKKSDRPGLRSALSHLRGGDTLIVTKLDRLGRDLRDLVNNLHDLERRSITFRSLNDNIDTTSAAGKLQLSMIAAMAEFEHGIISERIKFAMGKARARGTRMGRQLAVPDKDKDIFIDLFLNRTVTVAYIAKKFGCSIPCVYSTAKRFGITDRIIKSDIIEQRVEYIKTTSAEEESR